jgi:hypothetical protein
MLPDVWPKETECEAVTEVDKKWGFLSDLAITATLQKETQKILTQLYLWDEVKEWRWHRNGKLSYLAGKDLPVKIRGMGDR